MGAYLSQRANPMINLVADNYALSGELIRVVLEGSGPGRRRARIPADLWVSHHTHFHAQRHPTFEINIMWRKRQFKHLDGKRVSVYRFPVGDFPLGRKVGSPGPDRLTIANRAKRSSSFGLGLPGGLVMTNAVGSDFLDREVGYVHWPTSEDL
jgi:hypothetical protein